MIYIIILRETASVVSIPVTCFAKKNSLELTEMKLSWFYKCLLALYLNEVHPVLSLSSDV